MNARLIMLGTKSGDPSKKYTEKIAEQSVENRVSDARALGSVTPGEITLPSLSDGNNLLAISATASDGIASIIISST